MKYSSPMTVVFAMAMRGGDPGATSGPYDPSKDPNLSKEFDDFEEWDPVADENPFWD